MRSIPCLALVLVAGCAGAPPPDDLAPRPIHELGQWEVRAAGRPLGEIVEMEIEDPRAGPPFFQVRNAKGQWLGYIDADGRVFRRVPFSMEDQFAGIHPMEKALELLYEVPGPLELVPVGPAAGARSAPSLRVQRRQP